MDFRAFMCCLGRVRIIARKGKQLQTAVRELLVAVMQMDQSQREANSEEGGKTRDADWRKKKNNLSWTLPAALRVSHTQTPFSPHEMTFWDEQKLDPDGSGCDILMGPAGGGDEMVSQRGQRGETQKKLHKVGRIFLAKVTINILCDWIEQWAFRLGIGNAT